MLQGGLIGCGYFARNHLHGWREVEGARLVAVCDRDLRRARAAAGEFGISRVHRDAEEMLRAGGLDFVDIAAGPEAHRALVELAASRGVHVICQKPMAPTVEDARAMVEACRAAGVRFMVHENFRWQTPLRALKEASRELGTLFWARIAFRSGFEIWRRQPYLATDARFIIYDLGVHLLDLARFFLGEAEGLYCVARRVNPQLRGEDVATVLLAMEGGAACVVEASYASRPEEELFPQTLVQLEGTHGSAALGPGFELSVARGGSTTRSRALPRIFSWSVPPGEAIQESVVEIQRHWVECLQHGMEPETSGADNLRTLELVFGAYRSAEAGRSLGRDLLAGGLHADIEEGLA